MIIKLVVITLMDWSIWVNSGASMSVNDLLKLFGMDVSGVNSFALETSNNLGMKVVNRVALLLGFSLYIDSICSSHQK